MSDPSAVPPARSDPPDATGNGAGPAHDPAESGLADPVPSGLADPNLLPLADPVPSGLADPNALAPASPAPRPGSSTFSLEGRAAPGLYLVGWLASVMGLAILVAAVLSGPGGIAGLALTLVSLSLLSVGLVAASGAQGLQRRAEAARLTGQLAQRIAPEPAAAPWGTAALPAGSLEPVPPTTRPGYVGPSPFLVFAASLPISVLATVAILGPATAIGLDSQAPLASLLQVGITAIVNVGLIQLLVVAPSALTWTEMGLPRVALPRAVGDFLAGAALAVPIIIVTDLLAYVLISLFGTSPGSPLPPSGNSMGFLLNFVAAAVVAPIGEETFYRAFATTAWVRGMGPMGAILRGAVFFAFVHILTVSGASFSDAAPRAFIAFAVRLPVALALGWVFVHRRSLPASIGLHATFNGLILILGQLATTG
ncbi:MAG TPA: CPBP family glutamic-type intramembrane protease [Candidatus Saccharimonadales bacterium]|nr:CPBP family glutamic-type intramembrane protease [Candidatus Saccharimonadales bacterium]